MNNIDELLLEYSIRTYDVRRADWNKLACYFRFGRDWKKIKFICRLKIFFNMAATYSKLFCCVQWVHICLQIKNLLNIRWIDEIRVTCIRWATKGIMVDWAQRCSLTPNIFFARSINRLFRKICKFCSFSKLTINSNPTSIRQRNE